MCLHGLAVADSLRAADKLELEVLVAPGGLEQGIVLAAFFHDCARTHDGVELDHGRAGAEVWRAYAAEHDVSAEMTAAVDQALLFHVDHLDVDPEANALTVCLCNADRIDRVRLGQPAFPELMYDDGGAWRELVQHAERLSREANRERATKDIIL